MVISTNSTRLAVETIGDGAPVLFIHGFPLSREMWQPTAERLKDRYLCIMPDLRGHGESRATESVSIADFADDLAGVLVELKIARPCAVVGLSMGGMVAFEMFRRHRAVVRALGLIDTRANAESPEGKERREKLAQAALREGSKAVADTMIDKMFAKSFDPKQREHWFRLMCATAPQGVAAASRALAERPDSLPTLAIIDIPTLVVAGDQDEITPPDSLREIHRGIPGSRFVIIPNAGHVPPVEQPDLFAAVLRDFLDQS